ncbi:MAG: hypothetical protein IKF98_02690 [Clostridia bacterium]|nr:hypothetical protein [Clostridia bacterium]
MSDGIPRQAAAPNPGAAASFVCRAWRTSNRWKSGRGYLPPSVANRKLLVATPGGEEAV